MVDLHPRQDVMALFDAARENNTYLRIAAPMVRYSRLAFRQTVRRYGVDLAYTQMIVADSFIQSQKAREADFATNSADRPLVAQFAASDGVQLSQAAILMAPYADAFCLNCGCPQKWAIQDGIGCYLTKNPEKMCDIVKHARAAVPNHPVSVKIRIHEDDKSTVEMVRRAQAIGAAWISVHGRTPAERHQPVHYDSLALIKSVVHVPVVANGDVFSLKQANDMYERTHCDGVMAARGLLHNPALFSGLEETTSEVVETFLKDAIVTGLHPGLVHHHISFMMEGLMGRAERQEFNRLTSLATVLGFLFRRYGIDVSDI
eukprot:TRINITY_DN11745_c0_g3_i1.p2 TRINITY_DN11745_c0_g3~~TRINITY_DN11745_c0_g3_i1.p2  ORF type:complete len:317 (+),score=38.75 TRINITY_DN11745_c0_g3_i1:3-953(+)